MLDGPFSALADEPVRRVERRRGALRHVGQARSPQLPLDVLGRIYDLNSIEHHRSRRDSASGPVVADRRQADRGLPGAGFPNQPKHISLVQG